MAVRLPEDHPGDTGGEGLDALSRRGLAIYESRLKPLLEPVHNGETVAIHIESGDYAVAPARGQAMRAARRIHSKGPLVLMTVGPQPDYSLAARLFPRRASDDSTP